jgi:hypothetical protein
LVRGISWVISKSFGYYYNHHHRDFFFPILAGSVLDIHVATGTSLIVRVALR